MALRLWLEAIERDYERMATVTDIENEDRERWEDFSIDDLRATYEAVRSSSLRASITDELRRRESLARERAHRDLVAMRVAKWAYELVANVRSDVGAWEGLAYSRRQEWAQVAYEKIYGEEQS